ncbi:VPLPA-CTERM sorting domain-containing protein [Frigidibacter sp. MR17.24]|uniref:VPLPA-CTERM sorting domain-containing protein n=1 Tax=Frigidibacter sp. MR17.24 TaxID=3127345 RepID=UPI00301302EE
MKTFGIAIAAAALIGAGSASAATLTFTGLSGEGGRFRNAPFYEAGFRVGNAPSSYGTGGANQALYLLSDGADFPREVMITNEAGRLFSVFSFDLAQGPQYGIISGGESWGPYTPAKFNNVRLTGFLNGQVVSTVYLASWVEPGTNSYPRTFTAIDLGNAFRDIDAFEIAAITPWNSPGADGITCIDFPCSTFHIDNVQLAPVPLPAAGLLLVGGLAAIAALRRRRT